MEVIGIVIGFCLCAFFAGFAIGAFILNKDTK